jgi:hypothetical protein
LPLMKKKCFETLTTGVNSTIKKTFFFVTKALDRQARAL